MKNPLHLLSAVLFIAFELCPHGSMLQAQLKVYSVPEQGFSQALYSPDGHYLVTVAYDKQSLALWEVSSGRPIYSLPVKNLKTANIALTADAKFIIIPVKGAIAFHEFETGKPSHQWSTNTTTLPNTAVSPDGRFIAAATIEKTLVWTWPEGKLIQQFEEKPGETVPPIAFSQNGELFAKATPTGFSIFETKRWKVTATINPSAAPRALLFKNQNEVLVLNANSHVNAYDRSSGKALYTFEIPGNQIESIQLHPNNKHLIGENKLVVFVWDLENHQLLHKKQMNGSALACPPQKDEIFVGGIHGSTLRLDDLEPVKKIGNGYLNYAFHNNHGEVLFAASDQGHATFMDTRSGLQPQFMSLGLGRDYQIGLDGNRAWCIAAMEWDYSKISSWNDFYKMNIWRVVENGSPAKAELEYSYVDSMYFTLSPDGKSLAYFDASGSGNRRLAMMGLPDQKLKWKTNSPYQGPVPSIIFSGNGNRIFTKVEPSEVGLWDATTGTFLGHHQLESSTQRLFPSPDGRFLVYNGMDGTVYLYDCEKGHTIRRLPRQTILGQYAFSDSMKIVTQEKGTISIVDVISGKVETTFPQEGKVQGIAFDAVRNRLYLCGAGITIWDTHNNKPIGTLHVFPENKGIVFVDPNGKFDVNATGAQYLYHLDGIKTSDVNHLDHPLYHPGLLKTIFAQ